MSIPSLHVADGIATIQLNRPENLNALTREDYNALGELLREIDQYKEVVVTLVQGSGRFFCSGTDVAAAGGRADDVSTERAAFLNGVVRTNTDVNRALYTHSKVLVAALNGPVMGIMAALLGHFDFIYAAPDAWLSTPFSLLGINSEGNSSATFLDRMGPAKAKEALIWGKKLTAVELLNCGFVNKICKATSAEQFNEVVRKEVLTELKDLVPAAVLTSKKLLQQAADERNQPDAVNLRESYSQARRFASGVPSEQFGKIARKEIKHKL